MRKMRLSALDHLRQAVDSASSDIQRERTQMANLWGDRFKEPKRGLKDLEQVESKTMLT